jgi:dienelactone hydrolase
MRERLVFTLAVAVIGLHALIDAFVALEPGVGPADHIVPGSAALVVLGSAAALYARVPVGARACAALLLGALAIVRGSVAVSAARSGGPAGDDWTAFLLLPAGAALVILGLLLLWRSRKPGGRRLLRRALLALAAALAFYWAVFPMSMAIVATERPRGEIEAPSIAGGLEDVAMTTADGLRLTGYYIPSRNGAAVIVFPGEGGARHARMLAEEGYGALLLDPRGYGRSEGDPNAFGWRGRGDLDAAVAWLQTRPDVDDGRVGGLGLSVGGEQMLEAAAGNDGLGAVVSEGAGIRSVRETFVREGPHPVELALQYPFDLVLTVTTTVLTGHLPPPSLEELAARIAPRAVFFVYGQNGQAIEPTVNVPYFRAAGEPKELWEVRGAGHIGGIAAQPDDYRERVVRFFDEALLEARR